MGAAQLRKELWIEIISICNSIIIDELTAQLVLISRIEIDKVLFILGHVFFFFFYYYIYNILRHITFSMVFNFTRYIKPFYDLIFRLRLYSPFMILILKSPILITTGRKLCRWQTIWSFNMCTWFTKAPTVLNPLWILQNIDVRVIFYKSLEFKIEEIIEWQVKITLLCRLIWYICPFGLQVLAP